MLNIRVLGRGLIPRGYGIAPRREPFKADRSFINVLVATPGLKPEYENPETKTFHPLDRKNVAAVWDKYGEYVASAKHDVLHEEKPAQHTEVVTPPQQQTSQPPQEPTAEAVPVVPAIPPAEPVTEETPEAPVVDENLAAGDASSNDGSATETSLPSSLAADDVVFIPTFRDDNKKKNKHNR